MGLKKIRPLIQRLRSDFAVLLVLIGVLLTAMTVLGALYLVILLFARIVFSGR